jgi:2-C-methyl-D-erythritol 2,4-cyclodiphosphate synthase
MVKVGIGIDFHRLTPGRKLVLGGVEVQFDLGLAGHSDADVLTHAVCDALLGAAGLGDLGRHFPDTDPRYKEISSLALLQRVHRMLQTNYHRVNNVDICVVAQQPRLAPYIPQMVSHLSAVLQVAEKRINIKATTPEGLGPLGRSEGIAAHAVATLVPANEPQDIVVGDQDHQAEEDDVPDVVD